MAGSRNPFALGLEIVARMSHDNRLIPLPAGPLQTREANQQVVLAILGNLPRECVAESEFAHLFWPHWVSRFAEHTQQLVSWALTKES